MSAYAALKISNFRLLLLSRLLVTVGVQIQTLAVGWQIYELTKNPLTLGLIGLTEAIPAIGFALYAGHLADIFERKKLALLAVTMLFCSIAMLAVSCTLKVDASILQPLIFVSVAISGFARSFYAPAIWGLISDIVPRELYGNAAAWNSTVWQSSAIAGPILGGFLYTEFSAATTYSISASLLLIAFVCFSQVKSKSVAKADRDTGAMQNIAEGLKFVFTNQIVLGAMALDLFAVLFGGAVALLPIFASEIYHMGPEALGVLRAAPPVGALLTSSILTHHPLTKNAGRWLMAAVAGFGLCMIGFGLSTNFFVSLALLAISGALDGISVYVRQTIFQLCTPDNMKGRVAAVNSIFIGSSNEIGEFESGVAAKFMGLVPSVIFGGCMTIFVVGVTAIKAPLLRNLDMRTLLHRPDPASETTK